MLAFVDGNWGTGAAFRVLQNQPYKRLGVTIAWPKAIIAKISEPGPLSLDAVKRIATALDRHLPPAT